jgi:hypothetical protein
VNLNRLCRELLCLSLMLIGIAEAAEPPVRLGGPYKLLAADFTGNGHRDLAVGLHDLGMLTIEQGNGEGRFQHLAITPIRTANAKGFVGGSFNIASGDLDGDGRLDLAVGCMGHFVLLARNAGEGRFEPKGRFKTESDAKGVSLADLDDDGRLDLLYTARGTGRSGDTATGRLYLRRGLGEWRFGDPVKLEAGISAYYVETADLNADGFLDVLVPNELGSTASYWISPGRSVFDSGSKLNRQVVKTSGFRINDVRARDFTGDGHLDILTANWSSSNISLFPGRGDGTFGNERLMPGGKHCVFFAVGDFDKDSDLDFAVTHWTEDFLSVFLNDGRGHFSPRTDYKTGLGNYGVLACDANGDGRLDLVTANYRHRSTSLLAGRDDGTFAPAVTTRRSFRQTADGFVLERQSR